MSQPTTAESPTDHITYVVVVHGIGEQRKNECVINVVNRFAEARRGVKEDDNRDVLTLGKASGQTGWSKVPVTENPWIEFDGIPALPCYDRDLPPFLGELPENPGENLRFVDLCWSDVTRDSFKHVGQDVDLWAKGLLGRLLRKHEAAETGEEKVPFWIRRVLHLLIDTLLLVRFAMNFRFKEMKELVFVKFLGDVQLYGEYSRCRGQAVRRFHELMARVEAAHYAEERKRQGSIRDPRYVIIAHSLGSIMSLDALLYASATSHVRRGGVRGWRFPGYLSDDDKKCESREEGWFALLDTGWIERVRSFVTLGSPIDKYLTIWWLNYKYLLTPGGRLQQRKRPRIKHFNYCDELDPVGHKLDVVRQTPVYKAVFDRSEDVVFNRYCVPGVAHNKYWTDQRLFRWILQRAIDDDDVKQPLPFLRRVTSKLPGLSRWMTPSEDDQDGTAAGPESPGRRSDEADKPNKRGAERPRWFRLKAYAMLLVSLYSLVPALVLVGTYASLTLAFQANGWRTAITAAVASSLLAHFGRRLIDLNIWWRQIQRHEAGKRRDDPQRGTRRWVAWPVRGFVVAVPLAWATLTIAAFQTLTTQRPQGDSTTDWPTLCCLFPLQNHQGRPLLVVAVAVVFSGLLALLALRHLPAAYRTAAFDGRGLWPKVDSILLIAVYIATLASVAYVATQVAVGSDPIQFVFPGLSVPGAWVEQLVLIGVIATTIYAYRLYRFLAVKRMLHPGRPDEIKYEAYASDASFADEA